MNNWTFQPGNCVVKAAYVAWSLLDQGFEVEVCEYPTGTPGVNHAQVRFWNSTKDEWCYLTLDDGSAFPKTWSRHFSAPGEETFKDLWTFIDEQRRVRGF